MSANDNLMNSTAVDVVGENAAGDEIQLFLVATEPWSKDRALALQAKLKNYVAFAADGQLYRQYPDAKGKKVRIVLNSVHMLGPVEEQFIEAARSQWCEPEGLLLSVKKLSLGDDKSPAPWWKFW